ncbi:unknown [Clostridium sp. CAG:594]|nr:unknown [Clostridium sp. CAG:594]
MIDKIVKLPDNLEYYVLDEVVYNRKIYFFLIQVSNLDDIVSNKCVVCEGKVLGNSLSLNNIEDVKLQEEVNNIFISRMYNK